MVSVSKKGYLREYLLASKNQFLVDIGDQKFGPSKWHTDNNDDSYQRYCNDALAALEKIKVNPKAKEIYAQAVGNLIASAEYAKKDMKEKLEGNDKLKPQVANNTTFAFLDKIIVDLRDMEGR